MVYKYYVSSMEPCHIVEWSVWSATTSSGQETTERRKLGCCTVMKQILAPYH